MVFGVGTSKDITIYEVLYSAKPRKISFNQALNLTLAQKKKEKKKDLVSDDMCISLCVSLTRVGIIGGI